MSAGLETLIVDSYARLCAARLEPRAHEQAGQDMQALWNEVEALGLPGLLTDYDGELERPESTALAIAQATGYHCVPLPVLENMLARALLRKAGLEAPAGMLALGIVRDAELVETTGQAPLLQGHATVPWARHASHVVLAVQARQGEHVLLLAADAPGLAIEHGHNLAHEPRDRLRFERVRCLAQAALADCVEATSLETARYRAALMTGAAESALDMTVAYVNARSQFGKPLGKFQAMQQSLAVFAGEVTSALSACSLAFSTSAPDWRTIAIAKMRADVAASVGCNAAHQAHGAIGVTAEYPLHLRTRRLWSWRTEDGSGASWARRLGRDFIARGADALWPAVTGLR
ncbi:hypothetical protein APR50_00590 [Variovorax paradoxus]|uniref:acyl-CoA dehydrogenase family protein n=1 Tax=Variovorax paradoxus TaxID=34073 RepID=UPI0006E667AE|nr:hypothetical protein APR52_01045 [Variovorax paradoxus]KPV12506.1 hypothetical protein APR50_00590 [Variovorax paradoxus]KPV12730.1 hypothetical protein APR49_06435 [Variovorax paradoxus]KPV24894.1 hypothetical protein APR51_02955 [Variovorax paradoxus]KPV35932.1 hypothetical protein APR48_02145 [Variovorax paradoxus]